MCACAGLVETRFLLYSAKRIPKQQGDHKQRDFRKCSRTIEEGTSAHVHMFSHSELPMCCVQYRNARFRIGWFHCVLLAGRRGYDAPATAPITVPLCAFPCAPSRGAISQAVLARLSDVLPGPW